MGEQDGNAEACFEQVFHQDYAEYGSQGRPVSLARRWTLFEGSLGDSEAKSVAGFRPPCCRPGFGIDVTQNCMAATDRTSKQRVP